MFCWALLATATQANNKKYPFDTDLESDFLNVLIVCSAVEKEKIVCVCADSPVFLPGKISSAVGITRLPFFSVFKRNYKESTSDSREDTVFLLFCFRNVSIIIIIFFRKTLFFFF